MFRQTIGQLASGSIKTVLSEGSIVHFLGNEPVTNIMPEISPSIHAPQHRLLASAAPKHVESR